MANNKIMKQANNESKKVTLEYVRKNTVFSNSKFHSKYEDGSFRSYTELQFLKIVKNSIGFYNIKSKLAREKLCNKLAILISDIMKDNYADFIEKGIAGYSEGFHTLPQGKVFCKKGPKIHQPSPVCNWDDLKKMIEGCFSGSDEVKFFHAWCKLAFEDLRDRRFSPNMALVLAGKISTGKTLMKTFLSVLLGDRGGYGEPFSSFSGKTNFNGDLLQYELQAIDDDGLNPSSKSRDLLTEHIKKFCVAGQRRIEPKNIEASYIRTYGRLVICVNTEDSSLNVLPPLQGSVADKIMILQTKDETAKRFDKLGVAGRDDLFEKICSQIPGYLHWLLNEFTVTPEMHQNPDELRMRCDAYKSPDVLNIIMETSYEHEILDWLLLFFKLNDLQEWTGTARQLHVELLRASKSHSEEKGFEVWLNGIAGHASLGSKLGKAAGTTKGCKSGGLVLKQSRTSTSREWVITSGSNMKNSNLTSLGTEPDLAA